ncbi:Probable cytochrome P450 305a1, partial [Eumeta japonica]
MIIGIVTLTFCLGVWYLVREILKPKNFPPGPKWYPIIGCNNLMQRKIREHGSQWKALSHMAKEYSTQVLGLKLGSELVVVVYGEKNIRRVLTDKEFDGRPDNFFMRLRCFGKRLGITSTDGDLWKEHRKFTVKHLKNVGFGTTLMEKEIQREMVNIVRFIKENGRGMSPKTILAPAVTNVLWKYAAGETIPEKRLNDFLNLMSARSRAFSMAGGWLNQWPWLRFILPELTGYSLISKLNEELSKIIK